MIQISIYDDGKSKFALITLAVVTSWYIKTYTDSNQCILCILYIKPFVQLMISYKIEGILFRSKFLWISCPYRSSYIYFLYLSDDDTGFRHLSEMFKTSLRFFVLFFFSFTFDNFYTWRCNKQDNSLDTSI